MGRDFQANGFRTIFKNAFSFIWIYLFRFLLKKQSFPIWSECSIHRVNLDKCHSAVESVITATLAPLWRGSRRDNTFNSSLDKARTRIRILNCESIRMNFENSIHSNSKIVFVLLFKFIRIQRFVFEYSEIIFFFSYLHFAISRACI